MVIAFGFASFTETIGRSTFTKKMQNNLIVKNVCSNCNQYFGNNLDNILARQKPYNTLRDEIIKPIYLQGIIGPGDPIGSKIARALTKISFNYVAKITENLGINSPVYNDDFNKARNYILKDENPNYAIVMATNEKLLTTMDNYHLIMADIVRITYEWLFVVYLELYQAFSFQITLSKNYKGVHLPSLPVSHIYDLNSAECKKMDP